VLAAGLRWLLTQTVRSNSLRNGRSRSLYRSIGMVVKEFVAINDGMENILSLEE
jgi:hypothetical protein